MLKDLIKVATKLDALGLTTEANQIDNLIRKIAETGDDEFSTMWNSLSNEEKDNLNFETDKYLSYYNSFSEDPEGDPSGWPESLYLEYLGEEGYPTPTRERKKEILKEVKRQRKGSLLRSEKIDSEEKERQARHGAGSLYSPVLWLLPPQHRGDNW